MKKKQITKLFAVMAIAASPAAANPAAQPDPWAVSTTVSPLSPDDASAAMAAVITIGFAALTRPRPVAAPTPVVAARPRTTPSGAPACGNVASRAPRPESCQSPSAPILADVPAPARPTTAIAIKPTTGGAK
jgi:hypothetical protein